MPKTKKQTKKATSRKVVKSSDRKPKLTDDQVRIQLLKTEVHYFKGLAIMMVVLIFCVFIAFGCLFSAMYMEVRATRIVFQGALADFLPQETGEAADLSEDEEDLSMIEEEVITGDMTDWLVFEKYGFTAYFPNIGWSANPETHLPSTIPPLNSLYSSSALAATKSKNIRLPNLAPHFTGVRAQSSMGIMVSVHNAAIRYISLAQ